MSDHDQGTVWMAKSTACSTQAIWSEPGKYIPTDMVLTMKMSNIPLGSTCRLTARSHASAKGVLLFFGDDYGTMCVFGEMIFVVSHFGSWMIVLAKSQIVSGITPHSNGHGMLSCSRLVQGWIAVSWCRCAH